MLVEAEKLGVKDDGLADLGILVGGFLQLIRSAAEERTSPPPAVAAASVAAAVPTTVAPRPIARPPAAAASRPVSAAPAPAAVSGPRVYALDDEGVSPPVVLQQQMPVMPVQLQQITKALRTQGVLDVIIDEAGSVVDVTMRQSLNSTIDG